jgi:hypothetical protein
MKQSWRWLQSFTVLSQRKEPASISFLKTGTE